MKIISKFDYMTKTENCDLLYVMHLDFKLQLKLVLFDY